MNYKASYIIYFFNFFWLLVFKMRSFKVKSLLFRRHGSRHDLFGSFLCFNKILFICLFDWLNNINNFFVMIVWEYEKCFVLGSIELFFARPVLFYAFTTLSIILVNLSFVKCFTQMQKLKWKINILSFFLLNTRFQKT